MRHAHRYACYNKTVLYYQPVINHHSNPEYRVGHVAIVFAAPTESAQFHAATVRFPIPTDQWPARQDAQSTCQAPGGHGRPPVARTRKRPRWRTLWIGQSRRCLWVPAFDRGQGLPRVVPARHAGQHCHRIPRAGWAVLAGLDLGVDVGQVGFPASGLQGMLSGLTDKQPPVIQIGRGLPILVGASAKLSR